MTLTERTELARDLAAAVAVKTDTPCACDTVTPAEMVPSADAWPSPNVLDAMLARPDASRGEIELFLSTCRDGGFRSAGVPPRWAALGVSVLAGSRTALASWIAHPHGASLTPVKCAEAELLLRLGVRDLWMVADIASLRSGDLDSAFVDIRAVAQIVEHSGGHLTVALEIPSLGERRGREACAVAKLAGAGAVAVSAPDREGGAESHHVEQMRHTVGRDIEVVACGGIRHGWQARALIDSGADRIGTCHCVSPAPTAVTLQTTGHP
ncbi:MAG: hypothetical protein OXN89_16595 [Bryobacterales bacterium]|nr:hypothetical protein [Bryobacterales bacterium]